MQSLKRLLVAAGAALCMTTLSIGVQADGGRRHDSHPRHSQGHGHGHWNHGHGHHGYGHHGHRHHWRHGHHHHGHRPHHWGHWHQPHYYDPRPAYYYHPPVPHGRVDIHIGRHF
jgi:hypothetical protein